MPRAAPRRDAVRTTAPKVLAIDIGGTNVKILATGQPEPRRFPSGKELTPAKMVSGVKTLAGDWEYDVVSIGYPGRVLAGAPATEPGNLAPGWLGFDFEAAFGCPVKIVNDAAMQALGSYNGGTMLFLGLGTGLGSALVVNGTLVPMERRAPLLREADHRRLRRPSRAQEAREEEMAGGRPDPREAFRARAAPRRLRHAAGTPRSWERRPPAAASAATPSRSSQASASGTRRVPGRWRRCAGTDTAEPVTYERGDLKDLGEALDNGQAGLVVVAATDVGDRVASLLKSARKVVTKDIKADQKEFKKELKAATEE